MPVKTCGRRNLSPRFKQMEDSLAPRKIRTGRHLHPLQIHNQNKKNMLQGYSELVQRTGGGMMAACEYNRHASDFNPGFVTFVGDQEPGIWW
jgi:hypothetical protein